MSMDDLSTPALMTESAVPVTGDAPEAEVAKAADIGHHDLATQLVAKLCHDFISPAGAIMSGLDLLEDPSAQDMRQEALNLISASAKKLITLVHFARVAFGAATTSEAFSGKELHKILADVYDTMRAELDFAIDPAELFTKPAARALLNLGLLAGNALPTGGKASLSLTRDEDGLHLKSESRGPRARLKPEAIEGLSGLGLSEGLSGQWIQPHWLWSVVHEAGGTLAFDARPDALDITIDLPGAV